MVCTRIEVEKEMHKASNEMQRLTEVRVVAEL